MNRYSPAADEPPQADDEAAWVEPLPDTPSRLHPVARVILVSMGGMLIVVLGIAAWLTPNPDGFGTHRQIQFPIIGMGENNELPACSFLVMTGKPCPSCGMTTSWAHLMEGNVIGSLRANLAGTALCMLAIVSGPWMLISGVMGRWLIGAPHEKVILIGGLVLFVVIFGNWTYRLITW